MRYIATDGIGVVVFDTFPVGHGIAAFALYALLLCIALEAMLFIADVGSGFFAGATAESVRNLSRRAIAARGIAGAAINAYAGGRVGILTSLAVCLQCGRIADATAMSVADFVVAARFAIAFGRTGNAQTVRRVGRNTVRFRRIQIANFSAVTIVVACARAAVAAVRFFQIAFLSGAAGVIFAIIDTDAGGTVGSCRTNLYAEIIFAISSARAIRIGQTFDALSGVAFPAAAIGVRFARKSLPSGGIVSAFGNRRKRQLLRL